MSRVHIKELEKVEGDGEWALKKLNSRHRLVLYRKLAGIPQKDIAEELGYSEVQVSRIVNSPVFQAALEAEMKMTGDRVRERIRNASVLSVELLEDILVNPDVDLNLRAKTAESMLDRAGHAANAVSSAQTNIVNLIEVAYESREDPQEAEVIDTEAEDA